MAGFYGMINFLSLVMGTSVAQQPQVLPERLKKPPTGIGFGFFSGTPSGVVGLDFSYRTHLLASQISLGGNWEDRNVRFRLDQLWQFHVFPSTDMVTFPVFLGAGGWLQYNEKGTGVFGNDSFYSRAGLRVPFVMMMHHEELAIDVYGEVAPAINFLSSVSFSLQGGIGSRFYFF